MEQAPKCGLCRTVYSEKTPAEDPPCDTCRVVPVEDNEEALRIFFAVQNQLIMGAGGPVDLNHLAVHKAMDLYQVKDRRACFEKILTLSRWWVQRILEKDHT